MPLSAVLLMLVRRDQLVEGRVFPGPCERSLPLLARLWLQAGSFLGPTSGVMEGQAPG